MTSITEKAIICNDAPHKKLLHYTNVYIGNEFCERLIPSRVTVNEMYDFCTSNNLSITLLTPYLTNNGMNQLEQLLDYMAAQRFSLEIVINDWGVFKLMEKHRNNFKLLLGRMLTSHYVSKYHFNMPTTEKYPSSQLQFGGLFPNDFLRFLNEYNVSRLEFNNAHHLSATKTQLAEYGFKAHLYYPFFYLNTSRYCNSAGAYGAYARISDTDCKYQCNNSYAVMANNYFGTSTLVKGNSYYTRQELLLDALDTMGIERIIFNDFTKL